MHDRPAVLQDIKHRGAARAGWNGKLAGLDRIGGTKDPRHDPIGARIAGDQPLAHEVIGEPIEAGALLDHQSVWSRGRSRAGP